MRLPLLLFTLAALLAAPAVAAPPFLPGAPNGDLIVRFEADPAPALLDRLAGELGAEATHLGGAWPVWLFREVQGDVRTAASTIARRAEVRWAFPDRIVLAQPEALPIDDTYADLLWHLDNVGQIEGGLPDADINVLPAWAITTGAGVLIGVVDGGVVEHPDLSLVQPGIDGLDGDGDASPAEGQSNPGHGTCVAGLAAAIGDNGQGVAGVAYSADVLPIRLIGGEATLSTMYATFVAAVDRGVDVLNNSWGFIPETPCDPIGDLPPMNEALAYAQQVGRDGRGTVVVFSAGNQGCEQNAYPMLRDNEGVIGVGSVDDQARKWGYSVWGAHVDIAAPSGSVGSGRRPDLLSTDMFGDAGFNGLGEQNEYTNNMGGTSGAAPVIAGVVALMIAANPRLTERDVRRVLCATASKIDTAEGAYDGTGWSPYYGCGRVDAGAAVAAVANRAPGAPALTSPAPGASVAWDTATFAWTPGEDTDGDALTWALELTPLDVIVPAPADAQPVVLRAGLTEPTFTLSGVRWATGTWEARVVASDRWGRGAWSEPVAFTLIAPTATPPPVEEEQSCAASAAPGVGLWAWLPMAAILLRRYSMR